MAKRRTVVVPDRRWSADIILRKDGLETRFTTVIYGPNPSVAEDRKAAELGVGASVVARAELR